MKRRRVKITGIGPVTPAGIGREEFWKGILEPVSRVRLYTKLGGDYTSLVAAHIDRFDVAKYVPRDRVPKGAARHTLFALAAVALALRDAGITASDLNQCRAGIVTGSSIMDFGGIVKAIEAVAKGGEKFANPRSLYAAGIGTVPTAINQVFQCDGKTLAISNHCSSGMDAIAYAATLVATGELDLAICGGTDAPLHYAPLVWFRNAEIISANIEMPERQARPFDLWRTTGAAGEGAAMFILEPEHSSRLGYSFISGYGFANDNATDICGGLIEASRIAVAQASIKAADIDVVSAWGPGDRQIDKGEAAAMKAVFGNLLPELPAVSIKGSIGCPLGAAPAIQIAAAAIGQKTGIIPPTVNWEHADPACPLNLSKRGRELPHQFTLVNSHGFGAVNSAIVLERC